MSEHYGFREGIKPFTPEMTRLLGQIKYTKRWSWWDERQIAGVLWLAGEVAARGVVSVEGCSVVLPHERSALAVFGLRQGAIQKTGVQEAVRLIREARPGQNRGST